MANVTLTLEEYADLVYKADKWDNKKPKIKKVPREFKHEVVMNWDWNRATLFRTNDKAVLALAEELMVSSSRCNDLMNQYKGLTDTYFKYEEEMRFKINKLTYISLFKRLFCFDKSLNQIFNNG